MAPEPFTVGLVGDEGFELAAQLGVAAQHQVGLDPFLDTDQAQLVQAGCFGL